MNSSWSKPNVSVSGTSMNSIHKASFNLSDYLTQGRTVYWIKPIRLSGTNMNSILD